MDVIKFTDIFFAMEEDLDLFSKRLNGVSWWDPVRNDVFNLIYYTLSEATPVQPSRIGLLRRTFGFFQRLLMRLTLEIRIKFQRYDVLILRAPRHLDSSGRRRDIILDDIISCTPGKKLIINTFPHYYHIWQSGKFNYRQKSLDLCNINAEVQSRFGLKIDVESLIEETIERYRSALQQYDRLLEKVSPKFILIVQNGIEKSLFCAANSRSIPTVEAQHGLINYAHPAYSYPLKVNSNNIVTLPAFFLAFSTYWSDKCHYPVAKKVVVGNRQFFVSPTLAKTDDILVVSSAVHEDAIEKVLLVAARLLERHRFVYKLHPNQFERISKIKERMAALNNVEIVSDELTMQKLLERCESVFCISSTGVYEALQAGRVIYLLAVQDFQKHADLFGHPRVHVVKDQKELVHALAERSGTKDKGEDLIFFPKFDEIAVKNLMKDLSQ